MTNINVGQDGVAIELLNSFLTLDTDLFDEDGAAILVHARPTTTSRSPRPCRRTASPAA